MNFGKMLRELRIERGLTQKQLSERLNVTGASIRDWESRGRQPSFEMLISLAKVLEVTVGQLLGVEEY